MYPGCMSAVWCGRCDKPGWADGAPFPVVLCPGVWYQTIRYVGPGWNFAVYCGEVIAYGGSVLGLSRMRCLSACPCSMAS